MAPDHVRAVALQQHVYWSGPRDDWQPSDLATSLAAAGCPAFSERAQRHLEDIEQPHPDRHGPVDPGRSANWEERLT